MEPGTTGGAAGAAWKIAGGFAAIAALGAALAALVVMCATRPRSGPEWAIGITSTVVSSISGGAYAAIRIGLLDQAVRAFGAGDMLSLYMTLCATLGLGFFCGLPGWALVRWGFNYIRKREGASLDEIVEDGRNIFTGK